MPNWGGGELPHRLATLVSDTDTIYNLDFIQRRYKAIVKWKTGYYSFYLPVALAMYMVRFSFVLELKTKLNFFILDSFIAVLNCSSERWSKDHSSSVTTGGNLN